MTLEWISFNSIKLITVKAFLLLLILFLYALPSGKSDLGYRVKPLDLKLSQKFPPAIALEIVDSFDYSRSNDIKEKIVEKNEYNVVFLSVGFPEIEKLELDEMKFGFKRDSKKEELNLQNTLEELREQNSKSNVSVFSEEEMRRLRIAGLDQKIMLDNYSAEKIPSLSERIQDLIKNEKQKEFDSSDSSNLKVDKKTNDSSVRYANNSIPIKGEIEFSRDGNLYYANHSIEVRRFEEGVPKESGHVDLASGTFSIEVKNTKGFIVGRLINESGKVEGEGYLATTDLLGSQKVKLILKEKKSQEISQRGPVSKSPYGGPDPKPTYTLASFEGFNGGNGNFDMQSLNNVGNNINPNEVLLPKNLHENSEYIVNANAKGFIPTVSIINSLGRQEISQMPLRMFKNLMDIFHEIGIPMDFSRGDSLIYGVVKSKGKSVEGASIIASHGITNYFGNLYMPEQGRVKTSENGIFTTAVTHPGWNDLYISLPDGRGVHVNALVYPSKITYVTAEVPNETVPVTIRSFDAFSGEPIQVQAEFQQANDIIDTGESGVVEFDLLKTNNLSFITVNPSAAYEKAKFSYTNFLDFIHLPLITREWYNNTKSRFKVNDIPQTGTVLGFVQNSDFIIDFRNDKDESKVVYFNAQGEIIPKGIAGGGFLIFNFNVDQPNIVVISEETQSEITKIVKCESESIFIVNAQF